MEWTTAEKSFFNNINSPIKIQEFLDNIKYDSLEGSVSPRYVIKELKANCFEEQYLLQQL